MQTMVKDQASIHYLDYNPIGKPTVLLLHGLGVDGSSWGYQIPALCQAGFRPIAPDLPGFGQSTFTGGKWGIKLIVQRLEKFIRAIGIERMVMVGISMGGVLALQMALTSPEMVEKLVLVNTFASLRPKKFNEMIYLASRFAVANIRGKNYQSQMVAHRLFPSPEQAELRREFIDRVLQADPKVYNAAMRSLALFNARNRLGELRIPTLVISGANDTTVSLVNQRELVEGIRGARHAVIMNAGHAVIADQPEKFNETIIQFIQEAS